MKANMNYLNYKNGQNNMRHQISKTMTFLSTLLCKMKSSFLTACLLMSALVMANNAVAEDITLTVTAAGSEVRLTGPWWQWDPAGGPVAVDNADGTWTVTMEDPGESFQYLWVVSNSVDGDGNAVYVQEDLTALDNKTCAQASGVDFANRVWAAGAGNVTNVYGSCDDYVAYKYDVTFSLEAPGATSVRIAGGWWQDWAPDQGPVAENTSGDTWSVTLEDMEASFDYLWVVDGVHEDLKDNVNSSDCVDTGLLQGYDENGGLSYANRKWTYGDSANISETHDEFSCLDQFPVTFSVDMTGVNLDGDVPTLQGTFNGWCGLCGNEMTDEDNDGIWTLDVDLNPGFYQFKYAIGEWVEQEVVPGGCTNSSSAGNRYISLIASEDPPEDLSLPVQAYNGCTADTDGDGILDENDPDDDNDGFADADDVAPLNEDFSDGSVVAFAEAFGGALIESGPTYIFPADAQVWAGFANMSVDLYPFTIADGDKIVFNASVPLGGSADVRFKLERLPHNTNGDGEESTKPFYEIPAITVSGAESAEYTISLDAQDGLEFRSFIMYLDTRDVEVAISDICVGICSDTQDVSLLGEPKGMIGGQLTVTVDYSTSTDSNVTGLGLNVHYDSSVLTPVSISDILAYKSFIAPSVDSIQSESADEDGVAATDKYINMAWSDFTGSTWPGNLPENLLTITFDVIDDDSVESTVIGFSASSTAAGYALNAPAVTVELGSGSWDFDGSTSADALTDGLLLLRYAFGLRGSMLTADATDPSSTLTDAEIQALIETAYDSFADIDASGSTDALTDGLLLLRYLFGLRGGMLVADATDPSASRSEGGAVGDYINSYMP